MTTMAKILRSAHSQAVQLPKAFRFPREIEEVEVRRQGDRLILEPVRPREWPESFWQAFGGMPEGFERPVQQRQDRESLDE